MHPPARDTPFGAGRTAPVATVPERLAVAAGGVGVAALGWWAATGSVQVGWSCPLRSATGVPCPLCGMTTSANALLELRPLDALTANPLLPVLAVLTVATALIAAARRLGRVASPRPWSDRRQAVAGTAVVVALAVGWCWQLDRFGLL